MDARSMASNISELSQIAVEHAEKLGCSGAKVSGRADNSFRITTENRIFTLANDLSSQGFGIGVHCEGRHGSSSVNSLRKEDIIRSVEEAVAIAKFSVPDEHLILASKEQAPKAKALPFLYDAKLNKLKQSEVQELMEDILKSEFKDKRIALERFEVSMGDSFGGLTTSRGVTQSEAQTSIWWSFMGMARDGEEVSGMDYTSEFSYSRGGIEGRMRADAKQFAAKILANLDAKKCPGYKGNILMSPRATKSLLVGTLMYHASGSSVMDKKSRWIDSIGQEVCSPMITIFDDPHQTNASGATSYDSDGIPTKRNEIITSGVLKQHLHSLYTAKRSGVKGSSAFAGGSFGLNLASGKSSLKSMIESQETLLMIDRFSGNVDALTGDFSGVAKSSRVFHNGKDAGAVTETMVAGNIFEVMKSIAAVSQESELVSGSYRSPWVLAGPVTVS